MQRKTRNMRKMLITATFAIPFAAAASMAQAEYGDEYEQDGYGAEADSVELSEEEVSSFADAMIDVQEIGQEWTARMQEADDEAQMEQYREESRDEMVAAIEDHGLSVDEYNDIATAAQNDPDLAQQIQEEVGAGGEY